MVGDRSITRQVPAAVAVLAFLLLAGCGESGDSTQAKAAPPEVTVAHPLVKKLTEWDEFTGRFEPVQLVAVHARVSGYVQEIGFQDGEIVEADQMLFVIDPRPYQATVDRLRAQIEQSKAELDLAKLQQGRAQQLVTTSAVAKAQLDQRNAELASAEAALSGAQAQLRQAELDLAWTRVTAPFKGRISDRRVDKGNLVSDQTLLTTIVQLDPIYLTFDMSESDFLAYQRAVQRGELPSTRDRKTVVQAHLVDEEDWSHQGSMDFVDNVVDQGSG